ncbi:MAG: PEGA domain-containing protein [Candidatus Nomurabacteria bacterium]|jgi:hypothetical protein|nr:PEGA domain-containing protein [Candidatus Nomurabacteria bacterium]
MDKLKRLKKDIKTVRRNELIVRILKYAAMTVGALALLAFSFVRVVGNRIDTDGLKPTALLQLASSPNGASIFVDDVEKNFRTPNEVVLDIGSHAVKMTLNGYHDWQKNFDMVQGQVLWLNYALFVPTDLQTDDVANVANNIRDMVKSRDNKWILLQHLPFNSFSMLSVNNPTNIQVNNFSLPADTLSPADEGTEPDLAIVEGDVGSRYFLFKYSFISGGAEKVEYIYLDRTNLKVAYNLTREFAIDIKQISFHQHGERQFYIIDSGDNLRLLDYNNKSVSAPLVEHALKFSQYDEKLTSISLDSKGEKTVGVTYRGKYRAIKTFDVAAPVDAYFVNYYNKDHVVVTDGKTIFNIAEPLDDAPKETELDAGLDKIDWLRVNNSGRIILAGSASAVMSYDQETKHRGEYQAPTRPYFVDDFHVAWRTAAGSGKVVLADFDGDNQYTLPLSGQTIFLSNDKKYLFSLQKIDDKNVLQRSKMIVD